MEPKQLNEALQRVLVEVTVKDLKKEEAKIIKDIKQAVKNGKSLPEMEKSVLSKGSNSLKKFKLTYQASLACSIDVKDKLQNLSLNRFKQLKISKEVPGSVVAESVEPILEAYVNRQQGEPIEIVGRLFRDNSFEARLLKSAVGLFFEPSIKQVLGMEFSGDDSKGLAQAIVVAFKERWSMEGDAKVDAGKLLLKSLKDAVSCTEWGKNPAVQKQQVLSAIFLRVVNPVLAPKRGLHFAVSKVLQSWANGKKEDLASLSPEMKELREELFTLLTAPLKS